MVLVVVAAGGEGGRTGPARVGGSFEVLRFETAGPEAAVGSLEVGMAWVGGEAGLKSICSVFKSFPRALSDTEGGLAILEVVLDLSLGATILVSSSSILDLFALTTLEVFGPTLVDRAKLA